jgi:hypothetical protein
VDSIIGSSKPSKWDSAKSDWETALRYPEDNETAALGILLAMTVDRLEDVKTGVTSLSEKLNVRM